MAQRFVVSQENLHKKLLR